MFKCFCLTAAGRFSSVCGILKDQYETKRLLKVALIYLFAFLFFFFVNHSVVNLNKLLLLKSDQIKKSNEIYLVE